MRSSSSTPQANLGEVQLGKLAQEKGGDPRVRQFGERMAGDHGQAAKEIQQLAAEKGVSVSSDISSADLRLRDRLAKLQPAAFDREYVKEMVKDHKQDVAEFRKMSEKAQDPTLKAWVGKTRPRGSLEDDPEHRRQPRRQALTDGGQACAGSARPAPGCLRGDGSGQASHGPCRGHPRATPGFISAFPLS